MHQKSYPLDLFHLLHRKKTSQKRENDLNGAKGLIIGTLIAVALWSLIFSIGLVIF